MNTLKMHKIKTNGAATNCIMFSSLQVEKLYFHNYQKL